LYYFTYYPLGSFVLQGVGTLTTSGLMFNAAFDPTVGLQRWGDYTSAGYSPPALGNEWPKNFYFIDEYTSSGQDQSSWIRGFDTPNF